MICGQIVRRALSAAFLAFGPALADLELRIALADDVDPAATANDLAIRVTVLEGPDGADDFHLSKSRNRSVG